MVEARELVGRWCAGFSRGPSPAVGSVLDVLASDVLEEERGTRPAGPLVEIPRGEAPRIDPEAFSAWTFGWPTPPGPVAKAAWATGLWPVKWVDRRLRDMTARSDARESAFEAMRAEQGPLPWETLADMEVVSLAMGHFGPSRQDVVLEIVESALFARAVAVATAWYYERVSGMARDRLHSISELAESTARRYDAPFAAIADCSGYAVLELARRAARSGCHVPDPWSLPVHAYLPLLAASARARAKE